MLPKIDSHDWQNWGAPQKLDALNEAIQSLLTAPIEIKESEPVLKKSKKRK